MPKKRKEEPAAEIQTVIEPKIAKQQLKPNYFGAIAPLLIVALICVGVFAYLHTEGWHEGLFGGERYYCSSFFKRASGVVEVDGQPLCFNERGELASGLFKIGNRSYLAEEDGSAASGDAVIDGVIYIARDGEVVCEFTPLGDGLYEPMGAQPDAYGVISVFGESFKLTDGLLRRGVVTINGERYGYDEHGGLVAGAAYIDGKTLLFDYEGRLLTNARLDGWSSDENGEAEKIEALACEGEGVMLAGYTPPSEELSDEIDALLSKLVKSDMDERERVRAVYDWVCETLVWGNENREMSGDFAKRLSEAASSALARGDGRSQHYAALGYYMLNKMGFQTIVVKGQCIVPYGEFRDSYWCMTALEDGWYHFDPYCEDFDDEYNCFLVTDSEIKGISHDWQAGTLPASA